MPSGVRAFGSMLTHEHVDPVDAFVGRTRELRRALQAGEVLEHGAGHLVVVSGDAGVGKSRFCAELADRARQSGTRVVVARCWLGGGAPPLWPWQPILAQLCGDRATALLASGADVADVGPDRFARFAAVTERLAEACAETPVCLVVDDVQGADYGALLLIRFVARSLAQFPLLLVLGRRRGGPDEAGDEAHLLDELECEATTIALGGFDRVESEAFLTGHGLGALDPDLVTTLFRLTRGHPLYLCQIAQTMRAEGAEPLWRGGLQTAIEQAFGALSDRSRHLLSVAAVLGTDPSVTETAEVAGCDPVAVLDALDECTTAGLVATTGDGTFSFSHELVRAAVEDGMSAADRLDVHAQAAIVVADDDVAGPKAHRLARAAHHARRAALRSREDARRAVAVCEAAAQAMVRNFAYEQADVLFSAAVDLHTSARLGEPSPLLALQWAQTASLRGQMHTARDRYGVAVARAEAEGRPGLLAEAAQGWGGVWLDDYPAPGEKQRMLGLYRKALDGLPADDPDYEAQRCRLRVRLTAEAVYEGGPAEPLHAAVEAARRTGDPRTVAEALLLSHHALFTQEHTRIRPVLSDELVQITSETDQGVMVLMALLWRTVDLLHVGDPQFIRSLEVLRERATALGNQHMLSHVAVVDVLVSIGHGRLADAEAEAGRCLALGEQIGRVDAFAYAAAQLATIRWLQGRDAEMLEHIDEVATSPTIADTEFSFWALAACLASRAGDHDRARAVLNHCMPCRLKDLAPSGTWVVGLIALVEAATELGDRDIAAQAYDLLEPHADLPAVAGLGIVCLGSNERSLGLAAGILGRHDLAIAHLERAVAANQRLVNRPLLTLARADLAAALLRRADRREGDHGRATQLLRQAVADGTAFGLTGRVAAWEAQLATTCVPEIPATSDATGEIGDETGTTSRGVIRRDGRRWLIEVDGRRVRVAKLVGMRYLADLLVNPGQRIPAATLAEMLTDPGRPQRHEILDERARTTYAVRARELAADLAEAEADNDLHRAERLRIELDSLVDQLEAATGLAGRPRHFADGHERARIAVQKAIKRAIDAVEDADPVLGDMFRQTISTGVTCIYTPHTAAPITWSTAVDRC